MSQQDRAAQALEDFAIAVTVDDCIEAMDRFNRCMFEGLNDPPLSELLPIDDWEEFNRRAKLYFRQRVAERRKNRILADDTIAGDGKP